MAQNLNSYKDSYNLSTKVNGYIYIMN